MYSDVANCTIIDNELNNYVVSEMEAWKREFFIYSKLACLEHCSCLFKHGRTSRETLFLHSSDLNKSIYIQTTMAPCSTQVCMKHSFSS